MKKEQLNSLPEHFARYINKVDDVAILEALNTSLKEIETLPVETFQALHNLVYEPGKWTAKDIMQHLIDTERVFIYRAMAISRNEPGTLLSFDDNLYAQKAEASRRNWDELIKELILVHQSCIALFQSFTDEMLLKKGKVSKSEYSVLSIGYFIAGHQRWHLDILKERYYPLLKDKK